jgi:hypothetical protein
VLLSELAAGGGGGGGGGAGGAPQPLPRRTTTMTFTTFVMFDMFNAASCRSTDRSLFSLEPLGNVFFLWAAGGSILGQLAVVYAPPLQAVFQTAALSAGDWLRIVATASAVLWVDELMKMVDAGRLDAALRCAAAAACGGGRRRVYVKDGGGAAGATAAALPPAAAFPTLRRQ